MALVSTKGVYGLAALYELYCAGSGRPMKIHEISDRGGIPQNYLEQILVQLKKSGLVNSVRGAHGGYNLARDGHTITIREALEVLEGRISVTEASTSNPAVTLFWDETDARLRELFDLTIADLGDFQQKIQRQMIYVI